jgi:hypothetical protein
MGHPVAQAIPGDSIERGGHGSIEGPDGRQNTSTGKPQ